MNEDRRQILEMLAAGKITVDEAERLLAALEPDTAAKTAEFTGKTAGENGAKVKTQAKFLRVQVEGPTTVNVRVPMQLLRAGVRLASLIPVQAHEQLDDALNKHGVPLTLSQIKPENLEELVDHLEDLKVDVDGNDGNTTKVRVYCE